MVGWPEGHKMLVRRFFVRYFDEDNAEGCFNVVAWSL